MPLDERRRIGLLIDLAPNKLGSMEAWLLAFAVEATRRGHTFDVFTAEPVHAALRRALDQHGISWQPLLGLRRAPLRSIVKLARTYDVLHLNFVPPRGTYSAIARCAWPCRVLMVDHNSSVTPPAAVAPLSRAILDRLTATRIDSIAGVSRFVSDRVGHRFGLTGRRLRTIYNGVDTERFHPGPTSRQSDDLVVLVVANLIEQKGVRSLVEALARAALPGVRLLVAGAGPERRPLEWLAEQQGIRAEFLGLRDDIDQLLRRADIVVHPALWQEAFGFTVAEAMASGCAVIATAAGAIPELIATEVEGLLVPPGDVTALASALTRLANDPDLRNRFGRAARLKVEANFSLAACVDAHLAWCEEAG